MTASVVVVNWNSGSHLKVCVQSLFAATPNAEVVVVDNASSDRSLQSVDEFRGRIHLVRNSSNRGFAAAVNQGFAATSTPGVLVLNPDVRVLPGSVALLEDFLAAHPAAAAIGGHVNEKYLPRRLPTPASLMREDLGLAPSRAVVDSGGTVAVEQPAAAALMVRRDAYDAIGGFDERFFPAWYEDVDFCQRLKAAGWEIYFAPQARFEHAGGYSAQALGARAFAEAYYHNQLRYAQKHFAPAGRLGVRAAMACGMMLRMAARPREARSLLNVLAGALGGW